MAKIIFIDTENMGKKKELNFICTGEDIYRDRVLDALASLQAGNVEKTEAVLIDLLEEIEDALAEACRK